MKTLVLVILALIAAVVAQAQLPNGVKEGQTFTVAPEVVKDPEQVGNSFKAEECAQIREVTCQYLKKCSKIAKENECLKWEKFNVCVQEKVEDYKETKEICVQLETFDRFQPDKCYKCLKKGTEEIPAKRTVCAKYETQQKCLERGPRPLCAEYQLVKHCYEINPPYDVQGPKTCPANQEIFYTLTNQGANERALLTRQCRPVVTNLKMSQCSGALDPHMTSVTGQAFEFQHAGDFKFLITSDGSFECHVRYQHIVPGASWSGPTAFACRVNGVDVFVWDQDSYRINGHPVVLALNAAQNFPEGGSVTLQNNGQRVLIKAPNRAVFFMDFSFTQVNGNTKTISGNTYGQIPSDLTVSGLCAGGDANRINYWLNDRAYGLFPFTYEAKVEGSAYPTPTYTDAEKGVAEAKCTTVWDKKSQPTQFSNCVFDFLNAGWANRQAVLESEKDVQSQNINAAATVQK